MIAIRSVDTQMLQDAARSVQLLVATHWYVHSVLILA